MPLVPFDSLPDDSRIWIFAVDRALDARESESLLETVDAYLERWQAHGEPLMSARRWVDDHFLVIGVDSRTSNASGCSIDGLFRSLQKLEQLINARILGGGRIGYRDEEGVAHVVTRDAFATLATNGAVTRETPVFDTSLTEAGAWRAAFERPAGEAWTASLF